MRLVSIFSVCLLAACGARQNPASEVVTESPTHPAGAFPEIVGLLDQADAAGQTDAALSLHLQARSKLFELLAQRFGFPDAFAGQRLFAALHGPPPNPALVDEDDAEMMAQIHATSEARSLLWRSFVARAAILRALGHEEQTGVDMFLGDAQAAECGEPCARHEQQYLAYWNGIRSETFPPTLDFGESEFNEQASLLTLPQRLASLAPRMHYAVELRPRELTRSPTLLHIQLVGADVHYTSGSDCESILRRQPGEAFQEISVCRNVRRGGVLHAHTLRVDFSAGVALPSNMNDRYGVFLNLQSVQHEARTRTYTVQGVLAYVRGGASFRYIYGVDLTWLNAAYDSGQR